MAGCRRCVRPPRRAFSHTPLCFACGRQVDLPTDLNEGEALDQLYALKFGRARGPTQGVTLDELSAYYSPLQLERVLPGERAAAKTPPAPLCRMRARSSPVRRCAPCSWAARTHARDRDVGFAAVAAGHHAGPFGGGEVGALRRRQLHFAGAARPRRPRQQAAGARTATLRIPSPGGSPLFSPMRPILLGDGPKALAPIFFSAHRQLRVPQGNSRHLTAPTLSRAHTLRAALVRRSVSCRRPCRCTTCTTHRGS